MCEFCHKHGDGKKWYLQAKNYGEDLLADARRRQFIRDFLGSPEHLAEDSARLEQFAKLPAFVRRAVGAVVTGRQKKIHFGQVVPLEDLQEILGFVNSIVRTPCICRHITTGKDVGYCYGIVMGPGAGLAKVLRGVDSSFGAGPDTVRFERLKGEQALEALREHEQEGLCHTVWTFHTPFIGGICNCDRADCLAMRSTVTHGLKVMWRAEYVASVDPDACVGCRACMRLCQFGALGYSAATKKAVVDQTACYGCGICRSACTTGAIKLTPRAEVPAVAAVW